MTTSEMEVTIAPEYVNSLIGHRSFAARKIIIQREEEARNYLEEYKILELFDFLIGYLLVDMPDDPVGYLYNLLDECILFRAGLRTPPLLFDDRHSRSVFRSLDPTCVGHVSLEQYETGMTTMGIRDYVANPRECSPGCVDEETFLEEAKRRSVEILEEAIGAAT